MLRGSREVVALFPSRNANRWSFYEDRNASCFSKKCQVQAGFGEVDAAIDERAASVAVNRRCYLYSDARRDFLQAAPGKDAGTVAVVPGDTDGVIAEGVDGGGLDIGCDGL